MRLLIRNRCEVSGPGLARIQKEYACVRRTFPQGREKILLAIELKEADGGELLEVSLVGKLVKEDYRTFGPALERAIVARGKPRMLVAISTADSERRLRGYQD